MTVKLSSVRVDLTAETKGQWVDSDELFGVRFKVSALNLPAFAAARSNLYNRLLRQYKKAEDIPNDILSSEMGALFAQHILHGWEGFDEPYSADGAAKILSDPQYRPLVAAVQSAASKVGQPDIEYIEDEVKN